LFVTLTAAGQVLLVPQSLKSEEKLSDPVIATSAIVDTTGVSAHRVYLTLRNMTADSIDAVVVELDGGPGFQQKHNMAPNPPALRGR